MDQPIRAIYDHGHLRLLDDVDLLEGQEVDLVILSENDRVRLDLGDLIVTMPDPDIGEINEIALRAEVAESFRGQRPLSEDIIAERRSGH